MPIDTVRYDQRHILTYLSTACFETLTYNISYVVATKREIQTLNEFCVFLNRIFFHKIQIKNAAPFS